jgi:hypothetical protein
LSVTQTVLVTALPTIVYTMFGGVQAVAWDRREADVPDRRRLIAAVVVLILGSCPPTSACRCAADRGIDGRCRTFDFRSTSRNQYTFWSGTIAAFFLFCSYFGTDQSQVQRYLTTRSVDEGARVAADERLLEDSAAGAGAAGRRADVRVLHVRPRPLLFDARSRSRCAKDRAPRICRARAPIRGATASRRRGRGGDDAGARCRRCAQVARPASSSRCAMPRPRTIRGEAVTW